MDVQQLQDEFGIDGQLTISAGAGGLPMLDVETALATAKISLYGGQILSFKPKTADQDLLFVGSKAWFEEGRAIKGGIPVCWPWFGQDPEGKGRPAHGFARNRMWELRASTVLENGDVRIVMGLQEDEESLKLFPHRFDLLIEFTIGTRLVVRLVTANTGDEAIKISQALHSYYRVADIAAVRLQGLEGKPYLDKASIAVEENRVQQGDVTVSEEVDRIYLETTGPFDLYDDQMGRIIHLACEGSGSTVVWNPWTEIAAKMGDLGDEDYRNFLCVETANTDRDSVTLDVGEVHVLRLEVGPGPA